MVEEAQEVRRTAKDALSLQAEVTRLEKLLSEAGVTSGKGGRSSSAGKERRRVRATLERAENQKDTIKSLRAERGELRKQVTRLNREVARLGKRLAREPSDEASERTQGVFHAPGPTGGSTMRTFNSTRGAETVARSVGQGSVTVRGGLLAAWVCPGRHEAARRPGMSALRHFRTDGIGGEHRDPGMAVLGVVPGEERPAEGDGSGDIVEAAGEAGVVFQGAIAVE